MSVTLIDRSSRNCNQTWDFATGKNANLRVSEEEGSAELYELQEERAGEGNWGGMARKGYKRARRAMPVFEGP